MKLLERFEKLKNKYRLSSQSVPVWAIAIALAGFMAYYFDSRSPSDVVQEAEKAEDASTMIPAGFVLVPIEVANFESLDSILGPYGVVDLYLPQDETHKRAIKIAGHLKIMRAPLNPSHFAVLVPEEQSPDLVAHTGPFAVIVQNPNRAAGTTFVKGNSAGSTNDPADEGSQRSHRARTSSRITVEVPDAADDKEG